jgi:hypothetical protein
MSLEALRLKQPTVSQSDKMNFFTVHVEAIRPHKTSVKAGRDSASNLPH